MDDQTLIDREAADGRDHKLIEERQFPTLLAAHWETIQHLARIAAFRRGMLSGIASRSALRL